MDDKITYSLSAVVWSVGISASDLCKSFAAATFTANRRSEKTQFLHHNYNVYYVELYLFDLHWIFTQFTIMLAFAFKSYFIFTGILK